VRSVSVRLMLSIVVCLSCVSVTLVYCGQTVGWIKMKLGMQAGLGPGHIVLHGDPRPPRQRCTPPIFGPYLLRPNGCMNQDATWYGGRPRPMRLCVRWGPRSPSPKRGRLRPHHSRPMFVVHGQTVEWIKMVLGMEVGFSQATLC